jgi:hypothetical protein
MAANQRIKLTQGAWVQLAWLVVGLSFIISFLVPRWLGVN